VAWGQVAKVLRGGSWNNNRPNARAAYRNNNEPDNRNNNIGWRCVVGVVRAPGVFPKGQVSQVYGRGASAQAESRQICSRLGYIPVVSPKASPTKDKVVLPRVVGSGSKLGAGQT
jgi:hypothetical protein